jgi:hypothetical protein
MQDGNNATHHAHGADPLPIRERLHLRWAVLTAWFDHLGTRQTDLPEVGRKLDQAGHLLTLSSFSSTGVGSLLGEAEGALAHAEGERPDSQVAYWIDVLLASMQIAPEPERLLGIPSVKAAYGRLGYKQ